MSTARPVDMREALQAVLLDMRQSVDALAQSLDVERDAIASGDSHALDRAGSTKQALMHTLEQLDIERRQLECEAPRAAQAMTALWDGVVASLHQCHRLNLRNGSAVNLRLGQVRQALSILTGHAGDGAVYGRAGQLHASLRSQVLAEA